MGLQSVWILGGGSEKEGSVDCAERINYSTFPKVRTKNSVSLSENAKFFTNKTQFVAASNIRQVYNEQSLGSRCKEIFPNASVISPFSLVSVKAFVHSSIESQECHIFTCMTYCL